MDDHEVYLCWRLGEPEVGHWHDLDAGFAGRQKLLGHDTSRLLSDTDCAVAPYRPRTPLTARMNVRTVEVSDDHP